MNVTNGELVPNPLHQIITEHLDFTFSLGDIAAAIALVVAAVTFYISYTRTSRSEEMKTSRYLWERINEKYDPIIEIGRSRGWPKDKSGIIDVGWGMLSPLVREIDYFAFLVLMDEIRDVRYYRHNLSGYIEDIMKVYASPNIRHDLRDQYPYFNDLITEWNINMPPPLAPKSEGKDENG